MPDLTLPFILSQVATFIAIGFNILSFQYKKREHILLCLITVTVLGSSHYFLLNKTVAGAILLISVLRYIICYFTTNKKFLFIFIAINTILLYFTYKDPTDFIIYLGVILLIFGSFQEDNKLMRKLLIGGTSVFILYDAIIFSPMAVVSDGLTLISGFIGYYRFYLKNNEKIKKPQIIAG